MNSQQELLDAINTISRSKDRSCDTPAIVLRVEGDTVWVHIDGGADETPVQRTINCEQGQTVQVRISNGSAFLVGNASAPPTDDTTANVAHFVAVEADEKATEAIETANAIVQTVSGKVDSGSSNVTTLSSTMYQNVNGVNIYNDTLAVGDSYAHIDGDSFDIKQATTADTIDDANDVVIASFGREVTVGSRDNGTVGDYSQVFGYACVASGDYSHAEGAGTTASGDYSHAEGLVTVAEGLFSHAQNEWTIAKSDFQTVMGKYNVADANNTYALIIGNGIDGLQRSNAFCVDWSGNVFIGGNVKDKNGKKKTPSIVESTTISADATSYTFNSPAIESDSVIDIYDTIFGFAPTAMTVTTGRAVITFPAQSSSHTIKLFVY